jgi:hypothetical protein
MFRVMLPLVGWGYPLPTLRQSYPTSWRADSLHLIQIPAISICTRLTVGWIREILTCSESVLKWGRGTLELLSGTESNE